MKTEARIFESVFSSRQRDPVNFRIGGYLIYAIPERKGEPVHRFGFKERIERVLAGHLI